MIDQKRVIQLIGSWGYTPTQFNSYLNKQLQRAKDMGEAVGGTMYSSLLTMSKYALSGDADNSVGIIDKIRMSNIPEIKEVLDDEDIESIVNDENFSSEVIDAIYKECIRCGNLEDAEIAMREKIMLTVAPILAGKVVELGSNTAEQILQCFVGADHSAQYERNDALLHKVSSNLKKLAENISGFKDEINACKNTPFDPFNNIADAIIGDVDDIISEINQDMLSILGKPPHIWTSYSISFGKMMAGFVLALSFGYVTYEDYERLLSTFKVAMDAEDPMTTVKFGRN